MCCWVGLDPPGHPWACSGGLWKLWPPCSPQVLTRAPTGLQLLERDTTKRLGVTGNIKIHPFFKTINWTLLEKRAVEPPFKPKVVRDPTPMGAPTGCCPPLPSCWASPLLCFSLASFTCLPPLHSASKPAFPASPAHSVTASTLVFSPSLSLTHSVSQETVGTADPDIL